MFTLPRAALGLLGAGLLYGVTLIQDDSEPVYLLEGACGHHAVFIGLGLLLPIHDGAAGQTAPGKLVLVSRVAVTKLLLADNTREY